MPAPNVELRQPHTPHQPQTEKEADEQTPTEEATETLNQLEATLNDEVTQISKSTAEATMAVPKAELSPPERSRLKEIWQKMREATTNFFQKIKSIFNQEEVPDVTADLEEVKPAIKKMEGLPVQFGKSPEILKLPAELKEYQRISSLSARKPETYFEDDMGRRIYFINKNDLDRVYVCDTQATRDHNESGLGRIKTRDGRSLIEKEDSDFFFTVDETSHDKQIEAEEEERPVADTGVKPPLSTITLEQDAEKPAEEMSFKKAVARAQELLQDTKSVLAPEDRTALETAIANISTGDREKKVDNALVILDIVKKADSYPPGLEDVDFTQEQPAQPTAEEKPTTRVSKRERAKVRNPEDRRQFLDTRLQAVDKFSEQFIKQLDALGLSRAQNKEMRRKFIAGELKDDDFDNLLKFRGINPEKNNAAVNALEETYKQLMLTSDTSYQEGLRFDNEGRQKQAAIKPEVKPAVEPVQAESAPATPKIVMDVNKVEPKEMPVAADTSVFGQDRLREDDDAGGTVEEDAGTPRPDNVENINDHRPKQEKHAKEPTEDELTNIDIALEKQFNARRKELLTDEQLAAIPSGDFGRVKFAYHETNRELVITGPVDNYLTHLDREKTTRLLDGELLVPENLRKFTKAYGAEEVQAEAA